MPTSARSPLTDLAGLGLLGWAVLLGYVSVPWMLSRGLLWDGGISLLGAPWRPRTWWRRSGVTRRAGVGAVGWACGWAAIGLFGSGVVLLTLAPSVLGRRGRRSLGGFAGAGAGDSGGDGARLRLDRRRSCCGRATSSSVVSADAP